MSRHLEPERWARVEELFEELVSLPPAQRAAMLEAAASEEPWLSAEVESLLEHAGAVPLHDFGRIVDEAAAHTRLPGLGGTKLGPYRLTTELGRGGMGVVYLAAREDEDFDQRVAIKLLPGALFSEEMTWRFRNERRILASLEHPGIARFLDGGTTPEGVPFVVMEYVDGEPVDVYCARLELELEDKLWLFARICDAVRYAHSQLVVHRDIKPGNILIDATGAPKLLDFGIAKLVDPGTDELNRTATRIMTPHFASPEQITGSSVSVATDVYALGALLYLILSGTRAFDYATSRTELARLVGESDPAPPSAVSGDRRLEGDLDTIVSKAMRREPDERYASVDLLLRDVHAYLASLPISARPPTLRYRAGKFVRRHRAPVIAAAVATVAVLGGGVAAGVGMIRAQAAEEAALEEARVAEEISEFLVQLFAQPDPDNALGEEMTARELLQTGVERIDADLVAQPTLQARLKNTMARSFGGLGDFAEAESLLLGALDQVPSDEISLRADLLMSLGGLRRIRGDREGSLDVLVQAIEITRPRVDTTDMASMERTPQLSDALIGALQEVGVVLAESGEYGPAIDTLEHAYRLRERRSGSGTEATAASAAALASGYGMSGDTERARELYRSAIDVYSEVHDERHPSMLIALDGLATAYARDGQFDSALVIYERLRPLQRDVWGDAHPRTAQSLLNLGALNSQLGRYEEARTYLRESLEIETARFGPENLQVTSSLINLAIVNSNLGELEEAEALFSRAAGIRRATIGADNPRFASALLGVANMRRQLGRWQGSADAYAEALDVLRSSGDVPPPVLKDYAEVLRQLGRDAEAAVVDEELAALTADGSGEVGSA